ncbi:MAG TPA: SAM-dependent methyltransferase [Pseudonocardiaceae bacterium]
MAETARKDPYPPQGVDLSKPSVARVYDYLLGGTANWAIDREFGEKISKGFPIVKLMTMANRLFLHRAVRYLVRQGVRQFVDIGSGIPTVGNTHQVADEADPETRVVYVDNEPVAVAHSTILLEQHGDLARHAAINGDLRSPDRLWKKVAETGKINLDEPIGLLVIAVLHVSQPGPNGTDVGPQAIAQYRELLPTGSYLALSHVSKSGTPPVTGALLDRLKAMYDAAGNPVIWRTEDEFREFFGDFELVEPGITWTDAWHREEAGPKALRYEFAPGESGVLAGVARKV